MHYPIFIKYLNHSMSPPKFHVPSFPSLNPFLLKSMANPTPTSAGVGMEIWHFSYKVAASCPASDPVPDVAAKSDNLLPADMILSQPLSPAVVQSTETALCNFSPSLTYYPSCPHIFSPAARTARNFVLLHPHLGSWSSSTASTGIEIGQCQALLKTF